MREQSHSAAVIRAIRNDMLKWSKRTTLSYGLIETALLNCGFYFPHVFFFSSLFASLLLFVPLVLPLLLLEGKDLCRESGWGRVQHARTRAHGWMTGQVSLKSSVKKHSSRQNTYTTFGSVTTSNQLLPRRVVVLTTLRTQTRYESANLQQVYSMWEGSY